MLPLLLPLIGAGLSAGEGIIGYLGRKKALQEAQRRIAALPTTQIPEATKNALGQATTSLNAESPATRQLYDQMLKSEATAMNSAERNAPSGATALSVASNIHQGILDKMPTIAQMQEGYHQNKENNYYNALHQMAAAELQKQESERQKAEMLANVELGKGAASGQMLGQGLGGLAQIVSSGDFGNMFKGTNTTTPIDTTPNTGWGNSYGVLTNNKKINPLTYGWAN